MPKFRTLCHLLSNEQREQTTEFEFYPFDAFSRHFCAREADIMSDLPKGDEESNKYPDLGVAQKVFEYEQDREGGGNGDEPKAAILRAIEENDMTDFYEACCEKYGWTKDSAKIATMRYV